MFAVGILTPSAKNIYRVLLIQNKAQGEPAFTAREYPFQVVNAGWAPKRGYVTWAAPFVLTKLDAKKVTAFLLCKKHGEPNRVLSESLFAAISFDVISDEEEGEPVVSGEDGDKPDAEDEDSDESTEEDNKPDPLAATKGGSRKRSRRGTKTGNGNKRSNSQLTAGDLATIQRDMDSRLHLVLTAGKEKAKEEEQNLKSSFGGAVQQSGNRERRALANPGK